jgi:hypothetical protein
VYCGPVLFAYQPQEEWIHERGEHPHSDWRVLPRSPWNVAIGLKRGAAMGLERSSVEASSFANTGLTEQLDPGPLVALQEGGASLLAPSRSKQHGAGAFVPVELREVPDWGIERGAAAPPPQSPISSGDLGFGESRSGRLVPYASTGLRIAALPWFWKD